MHAAIFLWGFTGLFGKLILLNEALLVWYRLLISILAIGVLLLWRREAVRMSRRELLQISAVGVLVMLHWVTFYACIKLASISIAMVCLSTIALFASIIEPLVNRQRLDPVEILFSGLAVLGIGHIYASNLDASTGIVIGVISAFISATFSVFNKRLAQRHAPLVISMTELTSGFVVLSLLLPVYLAFQPATRMVPDGSDFFYLFLLAIVCTVLTWILSLQALRRVSAFTMGLSLNLEPIYGIVLAVLFAGEGHWIDVDFLLGASMILVTVILHTLYKFGHGGLFKRFRKS